MTTAAATVDAALTYLVPSDVKPTTYMHVSRRDDIQRDGDYAEFPVTVRDGRAEAAELSLDRQGFVLTRHDTAVEDFYDDDEVHAVYYPEVERLVKQATGASRVVIFDHTRRADGDGAGAPDSRSGVRLVHNDYTTKSGPQRVRDLLGDEAATLLAGRFAEINVWRPIRGPVERAPLALVDASSVAPKELVPVDLVYDDRIGEIYHGAYSPDHRWYYFPDMTRNEAVIIKGYDSATDGRARFTLHTAFDDPTSPADAAPRESIEVRALVFFDD